MDINSALEKIYSMHQFTIKLGLERIENLLDHVGNPHSSLKCFHIAGSNGKGSTASFVASLLMEAGFRVGLYTSPHFVRFNERIRIDGHEIEDKYIAAFVESMEEYIEEYEPTFFEITTALAFKYFNEAEVDFAVIETGLGGRLDATNVITPLASIITSISLEHTNILGDTIEKIATEKAGIIKPKTVVLSGLMPNSAEEIIASKALGRGCRHLKVGDFITKENENVSVQLRNKVFRIYLSPLQGEHQLINCALALKCVNEVLGIDNTEIITRGINNINNNSGIQGRYEVINNNPTIILDSAHNLEGVAAFINEFQKVNKTYSRRTLIFGAMKDKDISGMLNLLIPYFDEIYITQIGIERSATILEIMKKIEIEKHKFYELTESAEFVNDFMMKIGNECLVVLGSMYLLGEIKIKIVNKNA